MRRFALLSLAVFVAVPAAVFGDAEDPAALVFERGRRSQYELKDAVLTLRGGAGWVRSRRVFSDFVLTLQFRVLDDRTDAGIGVRTLTVPEGWPKTGYRLALAAADAAGQIVGRGVEVKVIQAQPVPRPSRDEWHQLVMTAEGSRITVTLDGAITSISEIEHLNGSVLFDVRRGAAEFRNITLRALPFGSRVFRMKEPDLGDRFAAPRLVREVKPSYPQSALGRRAEGVLVLECVVVEDGSVARVEITEFLDPELEHAAVGAVSKWRFSPGTLDGTPVPVQVEIQLTFTMR